MTIENHEEETPSPSAEIIIPEDDSTGMQDYERENPEERDNREDSRFKEGQILRFVRVRFPGNARSFAFLI